MNMYRTQYRSKIYKAELINIHNAELMNMCSAELMNM